MIRERVVFLNSGSGSSGIDFPGGSPVSSSLQTLQDGLGNSLPIQISETQVNFTNQATIGGIAIATQNYVDNLITGLSWKRSVRAATTTTLPAYLVSGSNTILTGSSNGALSAQDGITLIVGDRLLVKNESGADRVNNGIYSVTQVGNISTPYILTRTTDSDTSSELEAATTYVREGSTEVQRVYVVNVTPITLGVTQITFALVAGAGTYTNGTGLTLTGNVFSVTTNGISDSLIRQSAGLSIIGRSVNTTGDVADITAGSDNQVLRRSGTSIGFGAINLSSTNAVTNTLGVGNGGTGTATQFTQNNIVFAGASGVYSQSNNLTFNSSTNFFNVTGVINGFSDDGVASQQVNGGNAFRGGFVSVSSAYGTLFSIRNNPSTGEVRWLCVGGNMFPTIYANGVEICRADTTGVTWAIGINVNANIDLSSKLHVGGSIKTDAPTSGGTAARWKFGSYVGGAVTPDTLNYVELEINGTLRKLIVST